MTVFLRNILTALTGAALFVAGTASANIYIQSPDLSVKNCTIEAPIPYIQARTRVVATIENQLSEELHLVKVKSSHKLANGFAFYEMKHHDGIATASPIVQIPVVLGVTDLGKSKYRVILEQLQPLPVGVQTVKLDFYFLQIQDNKKLEQTFVASCSALLRSKKAPQN